MNISQIEKGFEPGFEISYITNYKAKCLCVCLFLRLTKDSQTA